MARLEDYFQYWVPEPVFNFDRNEDVLRSLSFGEMTSQTRVSTGNLTSTSRDNSLNPDYLFSPTGESISRFGGDGSDGLFKLISGTTFFDAALAELVVKNFTNIEISGTAILSMINAATNGTILILKSQGDVFLTSTAAALINLDNLGGDGGPAPGANNDGSNGSNGTGFPAFSNGGLGGKFGPKLSNPLGGAGGLAASFITVSSTFKSIPILCGAGGGSGGNAGEDTTGSGGDGGGALVIECGGRLVFTGAITAKGEDGENGSIGGAGGGGGGGTVAIIANEISTNIGTITVSAGTKGTSGGAPDTNSGGGGGGGGSFSVGAGGSAGSAISGGNGGNGGAGKFYIIANKDIV